MTKEKKAEKEEKQEGKEVEEEEDSETGAVVTKKDLLELSAKIDKMTDAFSRVADALTSKQEDEEEEKPKEEEEKQEEDEEEKPEEEEKQEDEEEKPKEEEEKKVQKDEYFKEEEEDESKKSNIDELIEAKVAEKVKSILGNTVQKRSKKIKKVAVKEQDDLLKIYSTPWSEIHKLAKSRGAN